MLVSTSAPIPINGQTPISAARIQRAQNTLARVDLAEKSARFAVLGYCNPSASYWAQGLNVQMDVANNPMVPLPNSSSSSTVTAAGSGVIDTPVGGITASPVVVPLDGTGQAVPFPPSYASLSTSQGVGVPIFPGAPVASNRKGRVCGVDGGRPGAYAAGVAPGWGDALARVLPAVSDNPPAIVEWMKSHAALVALLVGGAVLLTNRKGGR